MKTVVKSTLVAALLVVGTASFAQGNKGGQEHKGENKKAQMELMISELGLSADQEEKVKIIFKEEQEARKSERIPKSEMEKLSDEDRRIAIAEQKLKMAESEKAMNERLGEVLNEDQMEKFMTLKKQKIEKRKEFRKEKNGA
ncbi:hypothetical protein OAD50_05410 [Vicingaceae bacterium]|nr:hypothetical protein [Vicingaceae bacterium]MDB9964490.1 hypothetical protein [Vicingaceae bacterium]MDC1452285.1 hypothetical protein [Vicingaceae bacterium]